MSDKKKIEKGKVVISKKPCSKCGSTMWHYKSQRFPQNKYLCKLCSIQMPQVSKEANKEQKLKDKNE